MKRTVTALYETREEAERAAEALKAQHLADEVEICDAAADAAKRHHRGLGGWLHDLFGGHHDHHLYAEGLRRGHVLLTAKVDELNETRAAVIMEAAAMNLGAAEKAWREEGWQPATTSPDGGTVGQPSHHHPTAFDSGPGGSDSSPYTQTFGGVRTYTL
jgi:hypothetical protein